MRKRSVVAAIAALVLAGCTEELNAPSDEGFASDAAFGVGGGAPGTVFAMTNAAAGNEVWAFGRSANGTLSSPAVYSTGGDGSGAGLGSQGALVLSEAHRWLLAVNAGSDEVSVFSVGAGGLTLTDVEGSGGDMPISVTLNGSIVYVLNAGGAGNIAGFRLGHNGHLSPIAGSTRPLSGAGTGPAQIEFSPDGSVLVVTEKNTNRILTYTVNAQGLASGPAVHVSAGMTPFGFAFARRSFLLVSEAFGGAVNASATSSYRLGAGGTLQTISASVATTETAACWTVVTNNSRFAYVTNTGSGTVTGYAVGNDGHLTVLDADGVTGETGMGSAPTDADFSSSSKFLYVLNSGNGSIAIFAVAANGSLATVPGVSGLPSSATGLAAH